MELKQTGSFKPPTFVKWAGGKTQLLGQFRQMFPGKINRYFEPFLGSGAVFFYVRHHYSPSEIVLSDTNRELINCFRVVRDSPGKLIELLEEHKRQHGKHGRKHYYEVRRKDPGKMSAVERAARFVYLNKTCFNGLHRVNSHGRFNVPMGDYRNPAIVNERTIMEASRSLQGVRLMTLPFERMARLARPGDFAYFDPPYMPLSRTSSFTAYTRDSFPEREQEKLARIFRRLDKRGCNVMLSNSNTEFVKSLYDGYDIRHVAAKRSINCNGNDRGKIRELVVLNYRPGTKLLSDF